MFEFRSGWVGPSMYLYVCVLPVPVSLRPIKRSVNDQRSEPSSHRQSPPAGPHYHRGQGSHPGGLFKVNI